MIELASDSTSLFLTMLIFALLAIVAVVLMGKLQLIATLATFAYPNAKFNAMGNLYVDRKELKQLAQAGSLHNAYEQVSNRYYELKNLDGLDEMERKILNAEISFFKDVYTTVPKSVKPFVKCYLIKWEARYLKSLLAERYFNRISITGPMENFPEVELNRELVALLKETPSMDDAVNVLKDTRYSKKLQKAISRASKDFSEIDRILEEIFFDELNSVKSRLPRTIAKPTEDFINLSNDNANVKILLRAKKMGLDEKKLKNLLHPPGKKLAAWKLDELCDARSVAELIRGLEDTSYFRILEKSMKNYDNTGDLQLLELALDRYYLGEVVKLSVESSLTIGPTIRFLISKEFETRNLMTVFRGLHLKIPSESILSLTVYEPQRSET